MISADAPALESPWRHTLIRPRSRSVALDFREVVQFRELLVTLAARNVKLEYEQRVLPLLMGRAPTPPSSGHFSVRLRERRRSGGTRGRAVAAFLLCGAYSACGVQHQAHIRAPTDGADRFDGAGGHRPCEAMKRLGIARAAPVDRPLSWWSRHPERGVGARKHRCRLASSRTDDLDPRMRLCRTLAG